MDAQEFLRLYTGARSEADRLAKNPFAWGDGTVAWGNDGTGPAGFEGYHSAGENNGRKVLMKDDWAYQLDEDGNIVKNKAGGNFFGDFIKDIAAPVALSYLGSQAIGGLLGGGEAALAGEAAAAAGGEAAGGIARLAADPFGAAVAGNTAPLATSGTIAAKSLIPASVAVPIGAAGSVVPGAALTKAGITAAGTAGTLASIGKAVAPFAPLIGGVAGAISSKDQEQTAKREPWGPAQDWIKSNIKDGQTLQEHYKQNPFNDTQKAAMGQMLGLINNGTAMLPGLLGGINSMGGFKRGGGSAPSPIQFNTAGLLNPAQIDYRNPFGG